MRPPDTGRHLPAITEVYWAVLPTVVSVIAHVRGSLSRSGAVAAALLGTVAMLAGRNWGLFLITWFVLATVLSRIGRATKAGRTHGVVVKGDGRDAWQVLANGGVFGLGAVTTVVLAAGTGDAATMRNRVAVAAVGALAAAGADTWATEIGTLIGGAPWSLRRRVRVPVGTSGAVSIAGTLAMLGGAMALAMLAAGLHVIAAPCIVAVASGGLVGALSDSVLGAWWQERRFCAYCQSDTEQRVHWCGAPTVRSGGLGPLDNDAVNLCCTTVGALVAIALSLTSVGC